MAITLLKRQYLLSIMGEKASSFQLILEKERGIIDQQILPGKRRNGMPEEPDLSPEVYFYFTFY